MDKKLTGKIHENSTPPQNEQTYPTVQTVTDNTIKHKHTLWPAFISSEYWNHIFIYINWNTLLRVT